MLKKPASAKSKAAKAKREKMTISPTSGVTKDDVRERIEESFNRTWSPLRNDAGHCIKDSGWIENSYPSKIKESDILTAEDVLASEEQLLGKRGVPSLDDDVPDFLQIAAKAGPPAPTAPLDFLGRIREKRKERKITETIALGEKASSVIFAGAPEKPKRVVTVLRDHDLSYPDLYMAVYVVPDWDVRDDEARFAKWLSRSGCYRARSLEEADLVVFGGGSDVEPLLYGEKNSERHKQTFFNAERDAADMKVYLQARSLGIPIMGVCRGAQFLHVMNGGKLFQHIDGHMGEHRGFALRDKLVIEKVSSVHHQSCMLNREGGMEVLMTTSNSCRERWIRHDVKEPKPMIDIEAFYYRDTGCFGVQGHPEYSGFNKFSVWCLEQLNNLFLCSPDFKWEGKRVRMTPEARDAKEIAAQYIENAYNQSKEA